jgi:integrase/recombinase XerD
MTNFRDHVREYLALRRALGYRLHKFDARLNEFVTFLATKRADFITAELAIAWASESSRGHRVSCSERLRMARQFAKYMSAEDSRTQVPPTRAIPQPPPVLRPYIYTEDEILRLMDAARDLFSPRKLRCHTYTCLLGLLAVTGLRSGEAVRLRNEDVDLAQGLLTIRDTKFHKSRLVPVHSSTAKALADYAARRDAFLGKVRVPTFFISDRRRPISDSGLHATFITICRAAGIRNRTTGRNPRMHDLRHRFAVHTLLNWYRNGDDVEQRLPVLSTFLGHGHVQDTYWYLSSTPELLGEACRRLEQRREGSR